MNFHLTSDRQSWIKVARFSQYPDARSSEAFPGSMASRGRRHIATVGAYGHGRPIMFVYPQLVPCTKGRPALTTPR
jgi:hypothetical protein